MWHWKSYKWLKSLLWQQLLLQWRQMLEVFISFKSININGTKMFENKKARAPALKTYGKGHVTRKQFANHINGWKGNYVFLKRAFLFGLFVYVVFYFHTFLDNVTIQGNKEDVLIHDRNQKTTHPSLSTHNLIFKIKYLLYYGFFLQRCPLTLIFVKPEGFFFAIVLGLFFCSLPTVSI